MATTKKDTIFDKLVEEVDKIKETGATPVSDATQEEDNSVMGQLLSQNPIIIPKVGDVLEGRVLDIASNQLLLDLGALGTGIVLGKEIKDGMKSINKLKKGDLISATLIDLENEDGQIELSVREASYEKSWDDLESKRDRKSVV